jgi:hypothetical protein
MEKDKLVTVAIHSYEKAQILKTGSNSWYKND